ncbi:leucine-rich repeat-containing protein 74A isoform X2 [Engystomops pustulosus]|uniref:leucine-rich repeat-containing protein 74A isoform X2 n=1 Tax=Engystomops pustulosus TaxID=76066 RepID=UPI003AFAC1CA
MTSPPMDPLLMLLKRLKDCPGNSRETLEWTLCPSLCGWGIGRVSYEASQHPSGLEQTPTGSASGEDVYKQACNEVGVVPTSYFIRHMSQTRMNLKHHGLGPRGAHALAVALKTNTSIIHLNLEDNWIEAVGLIHLVQVLRENNTIQELDLTNNHLGVKGSDVLSRILMDNLSLSSLTLAHNGFNDLSAKHLAEAMFTNFRVTKLDLSHNEFCEKGGEYLGQMLAANEGLQELNLSWNHIRMKGAIALSAGLRVNGMLKFLDLSYNGFGNEGALALGEALRMNSSLLHLNISCNRISDEGVRLICKGLESNDTMRVLKMSRNPITVEGAITLLSSITKRPENRIEELDISNVLVNEQFLYLLDSASTSRPALHVLFAGKKGFITKKRSSRPDPMRVIQDFLDERKLRLLDFFKNMDKDGSMRIPVSEFCRYMTAAGLPLDAAQMESLVQRLDKDQTGIIDYRVLVDSRKKMVKEQRKQQRRRERRENQERKRSERALKSFHNAVRALTPPHVQREAPGSSSSSVHFSVTPCSSWYQEGEQADEVSDPHIQNADSEDLDAECSYQSHWSLTSQSHSDPTTPKKNTPMPQV